MTLLCQESSHVDGRHGVDLTEVRTRRENELLSRDRYGVNFSATRSTLQVDEDVVELLKRFRTERVGALVIKPVVERDERNRFATRSGDVPNT